MTNTKTLTPPEAVQALIDGKRVRYERGELGYEIHYDRGVVMHRAIGKKWEPYQEFPLEAMLGSYARNWSIARECYDLQEAARHRLACVAESMTEHAYQELASALEAPPRPR